MKALHFLRGTDSNISRTSRAASLPGRRKSIRRAPVLIAARRNQPHGQGAAPGSLMLTLQRQPVFHSRTMADSPEELLRGLLTDVSRSFYLTLRILPASIRQPIGLAYLLARTTDTIADTGLVSDRTTRARLAIAPGSGSWEPARRRWTSAGSRSTRVRRLNDCSWKNATPALRCCNPCPSPTGKGAPVLDTITGGQQLDLRRFAGASAARLVALQTDDELEDYTYPRRRLRGRILDPHVPRASVPQCGPGRFAVPQPRRPVRQGAATGQHPARPPVRPATGPVLPARSRIAQVGLAPSDLLNPANEPRLRPLFHEYLDRVMEYLCGRLDLY